MSQDRATPTQRRADDVSARARLRKQISERGFDAETERWFDPMLYEDHVGPLEAARAVGMTQAKARRLIGMPAVHQELQRRLAAVRTAEGPRSLQVLRLIRERAVDPDASAAQQKASIEAMKLIEGRDDERRGSLTIGTVINTPGLVIDLGSFPPPPPGGNGRATPPVIEHEPAQPQGSDTWADPLAGVERVPRRR